MSWLRPLSRVRLSPGDERVRLKERVADAVADTKLRSVGFTVQPSGRKGRALVAETALQKARGLRGGKLGVHHAMIFTSEADHTSPMTMRGVDHDLDLVWLNEAGEHLGHITMKANQAAPVAPPGPYRHAMEFEAGGLERFGIGDGSRVAFDDDAENPDIAVPHVDPGTDWGV